MAKVSCRETAIAVKMKTKRQNSVLCFAKKLGPLIRLAWPFSLLLGLCVLTFFLTYIAPGDTARIILGPNAREDSVRQLRTEMGLDRPVAAQFVTFLGRIATGRWGKSWISQQAVLSEIGDHLRPTASLCLIASIYSIGAALLVNALIFVRPGIGRGMIPILRLGIALPGFVVAIAAALATTRIQSWMSIGAVANGADSFLGFVLPGVAVALYPACVMIALLRDRFMSILASPFFRAAKATGYSRRELLWRVLLRNSWPTLLTAWVNQISLLVFSTIIVEYVFSFRGLGTLLASSIQAKDLPVLTGIILLNGMFFLGVQTISNRLLRPSRTQAAEPITPEPAMQLA